MGGYQKVGYNIVVSDIKKSDLEALKVAIKIRSYDSFNDEWGIRKLEHEVAVDVGRTGKLFILSRGRCLLMFLGTSIDTDFPIIIGFCKGHLVVVVVYTSSHIFPVNRSLSL